MELIVIAYVDVFAPPLMLWSSIGTIFTSSIFVGFLACVGLATLLSAAFLGVLVFNCRHENGAMTRPEDEEQMAYLTAWKAERERRRK